MRVAGRARQVAVGLLMAALMSIFGSLAVGAAVPEAVGGVNSPTPPGGIAPIAASGAGCGSYCNGGSAGVSRSTIQNPVYIGTDTNVSAVPNANPNVTSALYRDGAVIITGAPNGLGLANGSVNGTFSSGLVLVYGSYIVFNEQTQGVNVPAGSYTTTLVGPITQRPPNGTALAQPNGFDFVGPFTSSGKIVIAVALP